MTPRRLSALEREERRRAYLRLGLRASAVVAVLVVAYYLLPGWRLAGGVAILKLITSFIVFTVIVIWLTRRVVVADLPELRALEVIAIVIPLFLYLFANLYLSISHETAAAFSEPLDHTGALYLAITVFSTVGFGDITPKSEVARIVVSVQMLLDLVLLGFVVRFILGAAKAGLSRAADGRPEE